MDIWSWLHEVALLIILCKITISEGDLLESFRPNSDNPPELNQFLTNVLEHRNDFSFVRQAARKYQKMKKDTQSFLNPFGYSDDYLSDGYKTANKRHVLHYNYPKRKFRNLGLLPRNMQRNQFKTRRIRKRTADFDEERDLKKRFPQIIMLQEEDGSVHKRVPSPIMQVQPEEPKIKEHLPFQIYLQPEGERIGKRSPQEIVVESEGEKGRIDVDYDAEKRSPIVETEEKEISPEASHKEKKQALDLKNPLHHTYKTQKQKQNSENQQGGYYYVDLQKAAEKEKERTNERRGLGWDSRRPLYNPATDGRMYGRPLVGKQKPETMDYPNYENGMHHSLNDQVAFERALSYEIEPKLENQNHLLENNLNGNNLYNNPGGNNLLSVDQGRPDNIQPFYPQSPYSSNMGGYDYPPQAHVPVTNEQFFEDADNGFKRIEGSSTEGSSTTGASSTSNKGDDVNSKNLQHVGNGFIEITKSRRDNLGGELNNDDVVYSKLTHPKSSFDADVENERDNFDAEKKPSQILFKHSLHPLRVKDTSLDEDESFAQSEEMADYQDDHSLDKRDLKENKRDDEDEALEKRDLRNGEDHFQVRKLQWMDYENTNFDSHYENYDVPSRARRDFLDALGMKNEEDYSEDNPYKSEMTVNNTDVRNDTHIHTTPHSCATTHKPTSNGHQKDKIKKIKEILEAPETISGATTPTSFKNKKEGKRSVQMEQFNADTQRESRAANKEIGTKILQNKEKIYSAHEDRNRNHQNVNHVQVRQDTAALKWSEDISKLTNLKKLMPASHKINKKQDYDVMNMTEITTQLPSSSFTEPETAVNTTYEQVARQMDIENEKLAQVVNGHLASKIVSTVFDELRKRAPLKTKFYSGLSRKHVNFAGTIDFDIFKENETEDVDEARLLLGQITKVLNRLVLNQVRRKLCQRLPDELKDYLDILLNVKNTLSLEATNFVPNTQQGDFLFTYQEDKSDTQFDLRKLISVLETLRILLLSYHNMNEDCRTRAEPVRDYIEKHVKIAKQIVSCPDHGCEDKFSEAKRDTPGFQKDLVEKQLESVGLGKNQEFIPNFDLNQLVRNKLYSNGWKSDEKRDVQRNGYKSHQYRKLQQAAEKIREKRENERKIAEMFGGKKKRSVTKPEVDYEEAVVYNLG